jgi:hypothetical protein
MGVGFMLFMTAFVPEVLAESGRPRLLTLAYYTFGFGVWMFLFDRLFGGSLVRRFLDRKLEQKRAKEAARSVDSAD